MNHRWYWVLGVAGLLGAGSPLPVSHSEPSEAEVAERAGERRPEAIGFVGIVERKNIYHVISNMRGVIGELDARPGDTVTRERPLLVISPVDPRFRRVEVLAPVANGVLVARHVENGHFVDANQLLLEIASGHHYTTVVEIPSYEVRYFKGRKPIEMSVYTVAAESQPLPPPKSVNIEPPRNGHSLYRVEMDIDCRAVKCAEMDLAGALVKVEVSRDPGDAGLRLGQRAAKPGGGSRGAGK